jgi:hypothetical protein
MRRLAICAAVLLFTGCSDDNGIPDDGAMGEAVIDGTIGGEQKDSGGDWANPCTQGLCTPPGGGDMYAVPDSGMPDLTWNCNPYPTECGADDKCLIEKLCGDQVGGAIYFATCTYACYWP